MIDNYRLRVFRTVAHHLNFSRAGEELLLSQPAITQQIKALEDDFGVALFDRGGGRISLTTAGEALLPYADKMKDLSDEAFAAVYGALGRLAGELAIGASQTIAVYLLPNFIAGFLHHNPKVHVTARSGNTDAMLESLVEREIHVALIEGPEHRKDLHIEPFMEDRMVLVVPSSHEWADAEINISDLATQPFLMREFGAGSRRVIEQALTTAGLRLKDLKISMELDSTEAILSAVEAGLGVAYVSRWTVRNHLALGQLKLARAKGLKMSRQFSMAYAAGPEPSGGLGAFRNFLHTRSKELAKRRGPASRDTGEPYATTP
jgi:DNA-binding transcriptional LysR family regulator